MERVYILHTNISILITEILREFSVINLWHLYLLPMHLSIHARWTGHNVQIHCTYILVLFPSPFGLCLFWSTDGSLNMMLVKLVRNYNHVAVIPCNDFWKEVFDRECFVMTMTTNDFVWDHNMCPIHNLNRYGCHCYLILSGILRRKRPWLNKSQFGRNYPCISA